MEQELIDEDLESRLYAMIHYVDHTQCNEPTNNTDTSQHRDTGFTASAPRVSNIQRYWHTSGDNTPRNSTYQYSKPQKETPNTSSIAQSSATVDTVPKEEKDKSPNPQIHDVSVLSPPILQNVQKLTQTPENKHSDVVELQSSDEDEVIEVILPPKPTITIDSSDEDEVTVLTPTPPKVDKQIYNSRNKGSRNDGDGNREISASPVPSVVSSVSDDFIRGDCVTFNISSKKPNQPSFDFSQHGSDLLVPTPLSSKRKRKKNKLKAAMTNLALLKNTMDGMFVTPKNKRKNKKQNTSPSGTVSNVPQTEFHDPDGNPQAKYREETKSHSTSTIGIPNQPITEVNKQANTKVANISTPNISYAPTMQEVRIQNLPSKQNVVTAPPTIVLLDDNLSDVSIIDDQIVIANVSGFEECDNYERRTSISDNFKLGSTNIPEILSEKVEFSRQSRTFWFSKNCRTSEGCTMMEIEKFYNDSWGGENFDHRDIQKQLSRDKNLWQIDNKDRLPTPNKRKITCNYCHRPGHRDDNCHRKPSVCHMCGQQGHREPRCPNKICVNCGSPNYMYSSMCRNCFGWPRVICSECGQRGHPNSHCPDLWRRYHNTVDTESALVEIRQNKKNYQLFCSGCSRRGHLVHSCRSSLPFSGLPINSPYVANYNPVYRPTAKHRPQNPPLQQARYFSLQDNGSGAQIPNRSNKRQSNSPIHEMHENKRKYPEPFEVNNTVNINKSDAPKVQELPDKATEKNDSNPSLGVTKKPEVEPMPDFIPIVSTNRDNKGQIIQDNEVSDTSDVITNARVYVTKDVVEKLRTTNGEQWLKAATQEHGISVDSNEVNTFLTINGKIADQVAFQANLKQWVQQNSIVQKPLEAATKEVDDPVNDNEIYANIPKSRENVIRQLSNAFNSLKQELGDPSALFKELTYAKDKHAQLLKQKIVRPKKISNSRYHINDMFKKLNMVLLGQAGLADGLVHMRELKALRDQLVDFKQKNIPKELREQIGLHYRRVFAATPRDDYGELVKRYYVRNKKRGFRGRRNTPNSNIQESLLPKVMTVVRPNIVDQGDENKLKYVNNMKNTMINYQGQLTDLRPSDIGQQQARGRLMMQMGSFIQFLNKGNTASNKMLKKMCKVQNQAQQFLTKV